MSIAASKIHVGPARIYEGVTAPVTGTPPTLLTHTDGVPGTGTDMGATLGDASLAYQLVKKEIKVEQEHLPVDVYSDEEMASIECVVMEHTYATLRAAWDGVGTVSDGSKELFYFGGGTGILAPRTSCVVLTSRQRNAPTKFILSVLYKCYSVEGFKTSFRKSGESTYKLTFRGLADMARNAGDRGGQYFFEK